MENGDVELGAALPLSEITERLRVLAEQARVLCKDIKAIPTVDEDVADPNI